MGDRANVFVKTGKDGVYLYTHWNGTELPATLQAALNGPTGRSRWSDEAYLARIIFCSMVKGQEDEATGFGIATYTPDGDDRVLEVDCGSQTITERSRHQRWSFVEYCGLTEQELEQVWS